MKMPRGAAVGDVVVVVMTYRGHLSAMFNFAIYEVLARIAWNGGRLHSTTHKTIQINDGS